MKKVHAKAIIQILKAANLKILYLTKNLLDII